ncbi:MAG: response regulator transcription factor [Acidobacteria bacterium]|nr:response regulator transcription factor [Acidobacteriota bacterium]
MPRAPKPIRLVIADDERLFREALRLLLETEPSLRVVGYAADGAETVRLTRELKPDVLLLDLAMPRMGGLETLHALAAARSRVRTIIVTGAIQRPEVVTALQLGARGIVLKDATPAQLFKSIGVVMRGEYWVNGTAMMDVIAAFRQASPADAAPPPEDRPFGLTKREREIIVAVAAGRSNREIGEQFGISKDTVKHHLTAIFDKVGASSRVELALFALHHRLI